MDLVGPSEISSFKQSAAVRGDSARTGRGAAGRRDENGGRNGRVGADRDESEEDQRRGVKRRVECGPVGTECADGTGQWRGIATHGNEGMVMKRELCREQHCEHHDGSHPEAMHRQWERTITPPLLPRLVWNLCRRAGL